MEQSILEAIDYIRNVSKERLSSLIFYQLHNILRLFDVLPNFPITTSEAMGDNYL